MSTPSASLSIEWFEKKREQEFLSLFMEIFGVSPGEGYFSWKYLEHPLSFNAATVAYLDGSLVGALGAVPKTLTVNGSSVVGTHELDMMVKQEYRNLGTFFSLFKFRLATAGEKGIALSFGMNDRILRTFAERFLGYRDVAMVPQFVRVLDPWHSAKRHGWGRKAKLRAALLSVYVTLIDIAVNLRVRLHGRRYRLRKVTRFDSEFDELWMRMGNALDIAVERTSSYLNWRYVENPVRTYEIYAAEDRDGKVSGFIVFTCLPQPHDRGVIVELVAAPGEGGAALVLLKKAVSVMKSRGAGTAVAWCFPEQRNAGALGSAGFVMEEQNLFLQVRKLAGSLDWDYLCDRKRWFISLGDNDFYYGCPL